MSARLLVKDDAAVVERPAAEIPEHREKPCWIDITDPTSPELGRIAAELHLHPLAVEDAQHGHERPKIDEYEDHYFIVFYAIETPSPGEVRFHEMSIFVTRNAIVTVHHGECDARREVERRFREGFAAPFRTLLPDLTYPSRRDSQYAVSIRQPRFAESCELGIARGDDERLIGILARLYDPDIPRGDTGRARIERNARVAELK